MIALQEFLRGKDGIEWREAVFQGMRVEYFRGKDFFRYFRIHPEKMNEIVPAQYLGMMGFVPQHPTT